MRKRKPTSDYYCVAVQRNYEAVWRVISQHATLEEAEYELKERLAYTGTFNYNNATLRVISQAEAKAEFGKDWEFTPIGTHKRKRAAVAEPAPADVE